MINLTQIEPKDVVTDYAGSISGRIDATVQQILFSQCFKHNLPIFIARLDYEYKVDHSKLPLLLETMDLVFMQDLKYPPKPKKENHELFDLYKPKDMDESNLKCILKHKVEALHVAIGDGTAIYSANKGILLNFVQDLISREIVFIPPDKKVQELEIISQSRDGFDTTVLGEITDELIDVNYAPAVMKEVPKILENLSNKKNPRGRLVILEGPPGSGKTHWVKGLIAKADPDEVQFILLPANLVQALNGPEFANFLISDVKESGKSTVLVVEDGDFLVLPRMGDNMGSISSLLNLCDGLLGALLDIKVIVTTNGKEEKMDPALLRKGRLLAKLHIGALSKEQATKVYQNILKDENAVPDFSSIKEKDGLVLANIYNLALDK